MDLARMGLSEEQINFLQSNEEILFISKYTMQVQETGIEMIEQIKNFVEKNPQVLTILQEAGISLTELEQVKGQILQQYHD